MIWSKCHFGQNRSFLVKMVKIGSFWPIFGAKITSYDKIWESGDIILSLIVSKNYFCQVYGHKFGKLCR